MFAKSCNLMKMQMVPFYREDFLLSEPAVERRMLVITTANDNVGQLESILKYARTILDSVSIYFVSDNAKKSFTSSKFRQLEDITGDKTAIYNNLSFELIAKMTDC